MSAAPGEAEPETEVKPAAMNETCLQCRISKVRCDKMLPCSRCRRRKMPCIPQTKGKRRARRKSRDASEAATAAQQFLAYSALHANRGPRHPPPAQHFPLGGRQTGGPARQELQRPGDVAAWQQRYLHQQHAMQVNQLAAMNHTAALNAGVSPPPRSLPHPNAMMWQQRPRYESQQPLAESQHWSAHRQRGAPTHRQRGAPTHTSVATTSRQRPATTDWGESDQIFFKQQAAASSAAGTMHHNVVFHPSLSTPRAVGRGTHNWHQIATNSQKRELPSTGDLLPPPWNTAVYPASSASVGEQSPRTLLGPYPAEHVLVRANEQQSTSPLLRPFSPPKKIRRSSEEATISKSASNPPSHKVTNDSGECKRALDERSNSPPFAFPRLPSSGDAAGRRRAMNEMMVRTALEESRVCPHDSNCGPQRIVVEWLRLIETNPNMKSPGALSRLSHILVHLSQVSIASRQLSILHHVMKFVEYLGTVNIFVTNLVGSFAFLDMVDRDALLTNSARFVCPFSMRQNGIETNLCPVLYMTALCGRLVECDANDCFKANIVANIGDDENVFDLFQHMFDQSDMPSFYDALLEAYTKPNRTEIRTVPIKLKSSVLHQTGWLAFNPAKPTAQAKLFFNISEDGAFAAYSVCLFPCEDRIMNSQTPAQAKQPVAVAYETNFSAPDGDDKEPSES